MQEWTRAMLSRTSDLNAAKSASGSGKNVRLLRIFKESDCCREMTSDPLAWMAFLVFAISRARSSNSCSLCSFTTRAMARAFEYEISPAKNVERSSGNSSSLRATCTCARAVLADIPHCQLSQCAIDLASHVAQPSRRSYAATQISHVVVAVAIRDANPVISVSNRSNGTRGTAFRRGARVFISGVLAFAVAEGPVL